MVKEKDGKYQCEQCLMWFHDREIAQKCEDWCKKYKSCNLEIIKQAVKE